jgi:hypothetical protein
LAASADITFDSLLKEMTDLAALTRLPDPWYTVKQFSSYDRASQNPTVLTEEDWFANNDRGHFLRTEERDGATEWVLMDAEGPGAIVRIWSANPVDAGILRVYLDGAETPAIEMPFVEMLGGQVDPFAEPIAGLRSAGWNSYLPIPYAGHCKVTASKPEFFYHINYRTYGAGTSVEAYSPEVVSRNQGALLEIARRFADPKLGVSMPSDHRASGFRHRLNPGETGETTIDATGSALYGLDVSIETNDAESALRKCVLEISFDGNQRPSVRAPLGDFFATAPGLNPYASLPLGVGKDGTMYCRWVMPFQTSATLRLLNTGDSRVTVGGSYILADYDWSDRSLYFHAAWRGEYPIATNPRQDWTFVEIAGQGRFVGDMLHVTNPVQLWWGEGDEKIYVDNETFPSHFGTGTEDYYGYAWCSNVPFTHAYHNQPRCDGPGNYGQTCVSRFHILDSIPFAEAFKFDMEVWHSWECEIALAATSYWYARPGATWTPNAIDPADLTVITPPPLPGLKIVDGALEGEDLEVVELTAGETKVEERVEFGWSGGKQVRWFGGSPGDSISFGFPVERAGRYEVRAVFTMASRHAVVRMSVNGEPVEGERDLYYGGIKVTDETSLGVFDLEEGRNVLTAEVLGSNPLAKPGYAFSLDYLILRPAP